MSSNPHPASRPLGLERLELRELRERGVPPGAVRQRAPGRGRWLLAGAVVIVLVACAVILPMELTGSSSPPKHLDVLPFPGTPDASPASQISFPALRPSEFKSLTVTGSRSGRHGGRVTALPGNHGTAFRPEDPFTQGETVRVSAILSSRSAGTASGAPNSARLSYSFSVAVTAGGGEVDPAISTPSSPANGQATQSYASDPALHPPVVGASPDPDTSSGDIFLGPTDGPQVGPMILNGKGNLVWFDPIHAGGAFDLQMQTYHGQHVLTWWQGEVVNGYGTDGEDLVVNDHYQTVAVIHAGEGYSADLHELYLTPRGTALITAYEPVKANLSSIGGSRNGSIVDSMVQEIDIRTGQLLWEWHAFGHVPLSASELGKPSANSPYDYFHLNSIQELPDGNLLISARNASAIYEIDRATGRVIWTLGGKNSSFNMGRGTNFEWQHDARLQPNGALTLFDDAATPRKESQSRAIELTLNTKKMTATLDHSYTHSPPLLAGSQGDVEPLPNGDLFVGWGSEPEFSEYTASGKQIFSGSFSLPVESYRAFRYAWSAQPTTPPSVVVKAGKAGQRTVYASWNGATDIARWQLLAGTSPKKLTPLPETTATGFQTTISTNTSDRYLAVHAINSAGQVIGRSKTITR